MEPWNDRAGKRFRSFFLYLPIPRLLVATLGGLRKASSLDFKRDEAPTPKQKGKLDHL